MCLATKWRRRRSVWKYVSESSLLGFLEFMDPVSVRISNSRWLIFMHILWKWCYADMNVQRWVDPFPVLQINLLCAVEQQVQHTAALISQNGPGLVIRWVRATCRRTSTFKMTIIRGGRTAIAPTSSALERITHINANTTYVMTTLLNVANPDFWATVMELDSGTMLSRCRGMDKVIDNISEW